MVRKLASPPRFPPGAPMLVTHTPAAALSVCRVTVAVPPGGQTEITMPAEDAFVVLYQLRNHPPHEFRHDGKTYDVGPAARGTLNIVDLGGAPTGRLQQPVDTLFFHLPRAALDEIAEDAGAARVADLAAPEPWTTTDPIVDSLHVLILDGLADGGPTNRLLHDHLLSGLGAHFAATYGGMRPFQDMRGGLAPWQQRRAEEMLAANLSGDVSLHAIARECALSLAYFARAFKRSTGTTPHGWLQRRRIDTAKGLLAARALPLSEIALCCGFADQSHFTRIFGRMVGITPGAWQRRQ